MNFYDTVREMLCRRINASNEGSICRSTYEALLLEFDALDWRFPEETEIGENAKEENS